MGLVASKHKAMTKYRLVKRLGEGSSGCVWKAEDRETSETVAIKILHKNQDIDSSTEEANYLRALRHPNIVRLCDIYQEGDDNGLVLEYMKSDLGNLITRRNKPYSEMTTRQLCFQLLKGLAHMHRRGYCHRDLKPQNLLVEKGLLKIADLGLSVNIRKFKRSNEALDYYVVTRSYRAPELLLQSKSYGFAIDMWSVGVIMAELFTLSPIFCGHKEDQVYNICAVMGCPDGETWPEGLSLASSINYKFPKRFRGVDGLSSLRMRMPSASDAAIELIQSLCSWDPKRRPTAQQALRHPFFEKCYLSAKGCGVQKETAKARRKRSLARSSRTKI